MQAKGLKNAYRAFVKHFFSMLKKSASSVYILLFVFVYTCLHSFTDLIVSSLNGNVKIGIRLQCLLPAPVLISIALAPCLVLT